MSSEQENVSRAFLKSVLKAEAAEAEEPEEMADPESDRMLAEQLAEKYGVSPRARSWFRRPIFFGVVGIAVAAAAALLILRPVEPEQRTLTAFTTKPTPMGGVLQKQPIGSVVSLRSSPSWEIELEAQEPLRGEVTAMAFLRIADSLEPVALKARREGSNFTYTVTTESVPNDGKGVARVCFVICRTESLPSVLRLREAVMNLQQVQTAGTSSVRLPMGDCQLNTISVELPEPAPKP